MPQVQVDGLTINYDVQGDGDPLLLIPYLSADHACFAFQLPAYTEHFSCIAIDLPGSGESDKPAGPYSTESYADQVAAFLGAIGVEQAHVAGVSLGAAVGMHLAARHPEPRALALVAQCLGHQRSLSEDGRRAVAHARVDAADRRGRGHPGDLPARASRPRCTSSRPEFVDTLTDFVRSRPAQPIDAFLAQTEAAITHDAGPVLGEIGVPTLITVGAHDLVCSPRFAERLNRRIGGSELVVFEHLSHAGLHEDPETFNRATLDFLLRQRS